MLFKDQWVGEKNSVKIKRNVCPSRVTGKQILMYVMEQFLKTLFPVIDSYPESRHEEALFVLGK